MNEYELYMFRQEIVELNRTIAKINRDGDKWRNRMEETIDALRYELKESVLTISQLTNAIERAVKIKVLLNEDEWYNED